MTSNHLSQKRDPNLTLPIPDFPKKNLRKSAYSAVNHLRDLRLLTFGRSWFGFRRSLNLFHIEFHAIHDRLHDAIDLGRVFVADEFDDVFGYDLPGDAE